MMPDRILSQKIPLMDGRELRTTRDAILLIENARHSIIVEDTIALLRRAVETGTHTDLRAATNALMRSLRYLDMLGPVRRR
jgi:hypothetical protein